MNYSKPEATLLGDAVLLIQGSKQAAGDNASLEAQLTVDCELSD